MADRITNQQLMNAINDITPVLTVKLDTINAHLARLNGSVAELQHGAVNKETRITVLEKREEEERVTLEELERCVRDMQISQAKSAGIGAVVGALIAALPQLIQALR